MTNSEFESALKLTIEKHSGQTRKDGTLYAMHPIRVAAKLKEEGYDMSYQIAGLFHDLLEDTDTSEDEIRAFGEDILEAVILLSKNRCKDKDSYIKNILKNPMAKAVKEADRNDNLREAASCHDLEFMVRYSSDTRRNYLKYFNVADALAVLEKSIETETIIREDVSSEVECSDVTFYLADNSLFAVEDSTKKAYVFNVKQKVWKTYYYYDLFDIEMHPDVKEISKEEAIKKQKS